MMHTARSRQLGLFLALPTIGWLLWFLIVPVVIVLTYSLLTKGPYGDIQYTITGLNYERVAEKIYLGIIFSSIKFSLVTTVVCLFLGFPTAYAMATAPAFLRRGLLLLVMLPFLSNFVVRAFAIKVLLGIDGPVSQLALFLGLTPTPITFNNSFVAVWMGMITNYLPFMILPIYVNLDRFDFSLIEAARDLGAGSGRIFWQIILPLTKPGMIAGSILVFTPCLGEYVIPDLLGGARTVLLGNLITDQFLKARDWPFGAALSMVIIGSIILMFMLERFVHKRMARVAT